MFENKKYWQMIHREKERKDLLDEQANQTIFFEPCPMIDTPSIRSTPKKNLFEKKKKGHLINQAIYLSAIVIAIVCFGIILTNIYGKYIASELYDNKGVGEIIGNKSQGGLSVLSNNSNASAIYDLTTIKENGGIVIEPVVDPIVDQKTELQLEAARMSSYIRSLQKENDDIFAYIYIENSKISYPVVHGTDNDFYTDHDAYSKGYLVVGSIFLDCKNERNLSQNFNSMFFGHNMDNGTMFHDVIKFRDESYFRNTLIYIYTVEGLYIYKPFCFYMTKVASGYTKYSFMSGNTFAQWCQNVQSQSEISSDHQFVNTDKIITLSTCLNSTTTSKYRYALHAYLVDIIK